MKPPHFFKEIDPTMNLKGKPTFLGLLILFVTDIKE